jgi:hypothetical protein
MRLTPTLLRTAQRALRACAYMAVVAKLLVPAGYMPGPLAAGLPVQLCDAGFAAVVVHQYEHAAHPGHSHDGGGVHHEHDQASELHWKYCPSGALAAAGAIPVEHRIDLPHAEHERLVPRDAAGVTRTPFIAFRSRAPPLDLALV